MALLDMESPTEAAADSSARTFSQVLFTDIPHSYPPSTPVTCCYTLSAAFQPNPRDWVGIFKVGWSTTKDYHTFVWVEPCLDVVGQQSVTRHAVFKDYYLPKDEVEFYQFCYVDSAGQVRGASTPFCFKNPMEQSLESSADDDLLVITTQEQVEQGAREKADLQKGLAQMKAENETLQSALQREKQEAVYLKELNEQREKEMTELIKDLDETKEQNENMKRTLQQQLEENDRVKEELVIQLTKQMELQRQDATEQKEHSQSLNSDVAFRQNEERYDRAVMKMNKLKGERDKLKERIEVQGDEIAKLNAKLREGERELFKRKDSIQLLQVDLQSSEKEKERLAEELQRLRSLINGMDEVQRENKELYRRLSQQETPQTPQRSPDDDLKVQCQTLVRELEDTRAKLAAETEESRKTKRRAELLDGELQQVREQLENVLVSYEQEQRKNNKYELQLRETLEMMADKDIEVEEKEKLIVLVRQENEELAQENQNLRGDLEGLRRVYTDLQAAAADSEYTLPDISSPAGDTSATREQQETPEQAENLYEPVEALAEAQEEEESLVCRHCQESFPGITRNELEQHEQSHRVCPFCTMICDNMEQSVFEDHVYSHEL